MNHAVAVSTNNRKIVNVGLMSDCERGKWFRVMTFDKTLATVTVATSKIKVANFASQLFIFLHDLLAFGFDQFPTSFANKMPTDK